MMRLEREKKEEEEIIHWNCLIWPLCQRLYLTVSYPWAMMTMREVGKEVCASVSKRDNRRQA